MRNIILALISCICLIGCKSIQYVPVENTIVKTEYKNSISYDSIYFTDSVYIREKNDTVYIENIKYRHKYALKIDTVVKNDTTTNTIIQEVEVIKEVNKLKWWQTALMALGILSLVYIIIKIKK